MAMDDIPQLHNSLEQIPCPRRIPRSRHVINNETWQLHREDIHRIYVKENNTLSQTMRIMQDTHNFKASKRKYKMKLKEWNLEKNLPATDMKAIVAKASKRAACEGKETVFYSGGQEISAERIENFKKRKNFNGNEMVSPSVATPPYITYHTPRADHNTLVSEETGKEVPCPEHNSDTNKFFLGSSPEDLRSLQMVATMAYLEDDQFSIGNEDSVDEEGTHPALANNGESLAGATATNFEIEDELAPLVTPLQASHLNASLDLDIRHMKNNQDWCERAYRQVVNGCKKLRQTSTLFTLQALSALGVLRDEKKGYKEAESRCRNIIAGFEELGAVEDRLAFQCNFKVLLRGTGRAKERIVLRCLKDTERNKFGLRYQEVSAIRSLLESYFAINQMSYLESLTVEMQKVLNTLHEAHFSHKHELSSKGVHSTNAGSMLGEFVQAHPIFSSILPKLEQLINLNYGLRKIGKKKGIWLYNKSQNVVVDAAKYLFLAFQGLVKLGGEKDAITMSIKAILIEVLLAEFEETFRDKGMCRCKLADLIVDTLINIHYPGSSYTESPTGGAEEYHELDDADYNGKSDDGENDSMMDTISYKYGVTYSATEITGISDSIFMEP